MVKHCELGYSLLLVQELQLVFAVKHTNLKSSSNYLTKMEKKKKKDHPSCTHKEACLGTLYECVT